MKTSFLFTTSLTASLTKQEICQCQGQQKQFTAIKSQCDPQQSAAGNEYTMGMTCDSLSNSGPLHNISFSDPQANLTSLKETFCTIQGV